MIAEILGALSILKEAPGAVEAMRKLGMNLRLLQRAPEPDIDEHTPLGSIIKAQRDRLKKLTDQFKGIENNDEFDDIEKEKFRARIAAAICKLLRVSEPFKERMPDYGKIREFACNYGSLIPKAA